MRQCGDARSGIPCSLSSVEGCCRTGMLHYWDNFGCRIFLSLQWGGLWVLGLSTSCLPECSPPVLGGLSAASLLQELLQDEASCYSLSQINYSCQHQKGVLLQAVSFCPTLGMDKSPWERKPTALLGCGKETNSSLGLRKGNEQLFWVGLMCCQLPAWSQGSGWKKVRRGQQDCPIVAAGSASLQGGSVSITGLFERISFSCGCRKQPGDWLCSYLPVTAATGHPDRAGDKNPRLAPCANSLTYPCLAAFTGQLFNLVLGSSSAALLPSLGSAPMGMMPARAKQPPWLPPEPRRDRGRCRFPKPWEREGRLRCCCWLLHRATTAGRNKPCLFALNQGYCCEIRRFR